MYQPKSIFVQLALDTIQNYLKDRKIMHKKIIEEEMKEKRACFVSIHTTDGELRGCIGTILPTRENLYNEIVHNAVAASTQDPRFEPMTVSEIEQIEISVDVLSEPVLIKSIDELDCKKYGVIVSDSSYRRGVLLPDLEGVESVEEQLRIAKIKAGISEKNNTKIQIHKFTVVRYH